MEKKNIKRIKKILKYTGITFAALLVLGLIALHVMTSQMRMSDKDILEDYSSKNIEIEYLKYEDHSIRIVKEAKEENDSILLVFVHGAPGSWSAYKNYFYNDAFTEGVQVISYDRPGYSLDEDQAMPSIAEQAMILQKVIDKNELENVYLIGHSYGGPIVGYLASVDSRIKGTLMVSPLIDPDSEPIFWFAYFSYWKLTSWILPHDFITAGSEKFNHSKYLEEMKGNWSKINTPVIHFHGKKDQLAPFEPNVEFSKKYINNNYLDLVVEEDKGHLVIWTDQKLVENLIIRLLNTGD